MPLNTGSSGPAKFQDTGNNKSSSTRILGIVDTTVDNISQQVDQILSGAKTGQPNRADDPNLDCPQVCPGNQAPTPGMKSLVVTISPNSPTSQSTTVNDPVGQVGPISNTNPTPVLQANPSRLEVNIQNTSTDVIYLILTQNKGSLTNYHIALAACGTAGDGTGGNWTSDLWKGPIFALSSTGAGKLAVTEMTP